MLLQRMPDLPGSLTKPSLTEVSASGGGVSVSMEITGASWEEEFSVQGTFSSDGVGAGSSGGGVSISGSKFKVGCSCASLPASSSSDTMVMGCVAWVKKMV